LLHLAHAERRHNVGIKELSDVLGVSESYLSKIMSKLRQDGIVRAVTGTNGGYELARPADRITFLEVIQVIEGRQQLYECSNLGSQQHQLFPGHEQCQVKKVLDGAERQLHQYLQQHTIQSVLDAAVWHDDHAANKKQ
jgi:Rrf2 family protein